MFDHEPQMNVTSRFTVADTKETKAVVEKKRKEKNLLFPIKASNEAMYRGLVILETTNSVYWPAIPEEKTIGGYRIIDGNYTYTNPSGYRRYSSVPLNVLRKFVENVVYRKASKHFWCEGEIVDADYTLLVLAILSPSQYHSVKTNTLPHLPTVLGSGDNFTASCLKKLMRLDQAIIAKFANFSSLNSVASKHQEKGKRLTDSINSIAEGLQQSVSINDKDTLDLISRWRATSTKLSSLSEAQTPEKYFQELFRQDPTKFVYAHQRGQQSMMNTPKPGQKQQADPLLATETILQVEKQLDRSRKPVSMNLLTDKVPALVAEKYRDMEPIPDYSEPSEIDFNDGNLQGTSMFHDGQLKEAANANNEDRADKHDDTKFMSVKSIEVSRILGETDVSVVSRVAKKSDRLLQTLPSAVHDMLSAFETAKKLAKEIDHDTISAMLEGYWTFDPDKFMLMPNSNLKSILPRIPGKYVEQYIKSSGLVTKQPVSQSKSTILSQKSQAAIEIKARTPVAFGQTCLPDHIKDALQQKHDQLNMIKQHEAAVSTVDDSNFASLQLFIENYLACEWPMDVAEIVHFWQVETSILAPSIVDLGHLIIKRMIHLMSHRLKTDLARPLNQSERIKIADIAADMNERNSKNPTFQVKQYLVLCRYLHAVAQLLCDIKDKHSTDNDISSYQISMFMDYCEMVVGECVAKAGQAHLSSVLELYERLSNMNLTIFGSSIDPHSIERDNSTEAGMKKRASDAEIARDIFRLAEYHTKVNYDAYARHVSLAALGNVFDITRISCKYSVMIFAEALVAEMARAPHSIMSLYSIHYVLFLYASMSYLLSKEYKLISYTDKKLIVPPVDELTYLVSLDLLKSWMSNTAPKYHLSQMNATAIVAVLEEFELEHNPNRGPGSEIMRAYTTFDKAYVMLDGFATRIYEMIPKVDPPATKDISSYFQKPKAKVVTLKPISVLDTAIFKDELYCLPYAQARLISSLDTSRYLHFDVIHHVKNNDKFSLDAEKDSRIHTVFSSAANPFLLFDQKFVLGRVNGVVRSTRKHQVSNLGR